MVSDEIRCSTGERLQRVMAALESRSVPVESLHVVDSEPSFPLAWRRLLRKLGAQFDGQEPQAGNGSDLAKLQISLFDLVAGRQVSSVIGKPDGALAGAPSETPLPAGGWVTETLGREHHFAVLS